MLQIVLARRRCECRLRRARCMSLVSSMRGAGRRLDVDHELSGIGARKEGDSQQREQRQAEHEHRAMMITTRCHTDDPALWPRPCRYLLRHVVVAAIEGPAANRSSSRRFVLALAFAPVRGLDEARAEQRHHRHRHQIGSDQRQHHAQRQCSEQILADAVEKDDRERRRWRW